MQPQNNFDQTKLDQALGALARFLNALAFILEDQIFWRKVFIYIMIIFPIAFCLGASALSLILWFFGDMLIKAL